jgi:hypothetical protein
VSIRDTDRENARWKAKEVDIRLAKLEAYHNAEYPYVRLRTGKVVHDFDAAHDRTACGQSVSTPFMGKNKNSLWVFATSKELKKDNALPFCMSCDHINNMKRFPSLMSRKQRERVGTDYRLRSFRTVRPLLPYRMIDHDPNTSWIDFRARPIGPPTTDWWSSTSSLWEKTQYVHLTETESLALDAGRVEVHFCDGPGSHGTYEVRKVPPPNARPRTVRAPRQPTWTPQPRFTVTTTTTTVSG